LGGDQVAVAPARAGEPVDVNVEKLVVPKIPADDDRVEELKKLIRMIEAALSGTLTRSQLKKLLGECHDPGVQAELKAMLAEFDRIDASHKGVITREDLQAYLKTSSSPLAAMMAQALGL
jgi:Ca2+-binding EF-hand superfamily protein